MIAFLTLSDEWYIKFPLTALGVLLAALIPEIITRNAKLMASAIGVLALLTSAVQVYDDISDEKALQTIQLKLSSLQLDKERETEIRRNERRVERVRLSPLDWARSLVNAGAGFERKASRLSLRAALEESRLLLQVPSHVAHILAFPIDLQARREAYTRFRVNLRSNASQEATIIADRLLGVLDQEAAYRSLANEFSSAFQPQYKRLIDEGDSRKLDNERARLRLGQLEDSLTPMLSKYPLAGLYNHVGSLAMAQLAPERALGRFYTGMAADPDHIPMYESVAYASWALNLDSHSAIKYASAGLQRCEAASSALEGERVEALINLGKLEDFDSKYKSQVHGLKTSLESRFLKAKEFLSFVDGMSARLKSLYAYASALELQNRDLARRFAKELHDSDKEDPEYQDSFGFVLRRFAQDSTELLEARRLFKAAYDNSKAEDMTKQLATLHLAELEQFLRDSAIPGR